MPCITDRLTPDDIPEHEDEEVRGALTQEPFPRCGCGKKFGSDQALSQHQRDMRHTADTPQRKPAKRHTFDPENKPDWSGKCENCDESPIVPATGMCGPCTFGEASTAHGNW